MSYFTIHDGRVFKNFGKSSGFTWITLCFPSGYSWMTFRKKTPKYLETTSKLSVHPDDFSENFEAKTRRASSFFPSCKP